jgi:hypothetical protein
MRIWTVHPKSLDSRGLVAVWREALLAQAVLRGRTVGYRHHPQLDRFRDEPSPLGSIAEYLRAVHAEAAERGFRFEAARIGRARAARPVAATRGQLAFEWEHLLSKLRARDPERFARLSRVRPAAHPLFRLVAGRVAEWERR